METVNTHEFGCGCAACLDLAEEGSVDHLGGTAAPNGKIILTTDGAAANLVRSGQNWYVNNYGVIDDGVLNYGFWSSYSELATSYYVNKAGTVGFGEVTNYTKFSIFSPEQIKVAEKAIGLWDDLIDVSFQRTGTNVGDINFGNTQSAPGSGAYAYLPFGSGSDAAYKAVYGFEQVGRLGGDVWINNFIAANNAPSTNGSYMVQTMIHEIGHALGLSHTGVYNASQDLDKDGRPDPIRYGTHATFFQDTHQYSLMSYFTADNSGASHLNWHTFNFVLPSTPMVHDVLAVQSVYGADMTTRTGDTVYGFNSTADRDAFDFTATKLPVVTIWDAGGDDTLDFSGWNSNSVINLNEGQFSSGGGTGFLPLAELKARGLLPASFTEANYSALKARYNSTDGMLKDNISIAYGTVIENAVGGGGNDRIVGNAVGNRLEGNAGSDTLIGGDGVDFLSGGTGQDRFVGEINAVETASKLGSISLDVITDFEAGDLIDFSAIDANLNLDGNQAFTLSRSASNNEAGTLSVRTFGNVNAAEAALGMDIDGIDGPSTYRGPVTVVLGNVDGGESDFALVLLGTKGIGSADLIL